MIETIPYEYDPENKDTLTYQRLPDVSKDVQNELVKIAGLNRFGQPNLRVVKGNEVKSDKAFDAKRLKYSQGYAPFEVNGYRYRDGENWVFVANIDNLPENVFVVPDTQQEELGLLRYVVERWVSPEELEAQGRFQTRYGNGDLAPTLRQFPREGVYDCYQIIENAEGMFRKIDRDVLNFLKMRWRYEQKSEAEKEADREKALELREEQKAKRQKELWEAAWNFDIKLDKEEIERREHYWATKDDYAADYARLRNTVAFYPNLCK